MRYGLCMALLFILAGCDKAPLYTSQDLASNYVSLYERYVVRPCAGNAVCIALRAKDYNHIVSNDDTLL